MSILKFMFSWVKYEKSFITSRPDFSHLTWRLSEDVGSNEVNTKESDLVGSLLLNVLLRLIE